MTERENEKKYESCAHCSTVIICLRRALKIAQSQHCTEWNHKLTRKGSWTVQRSSTLSGQERSAAALYLAMLLCT